MTENSKLSFIPKKSFSTPTYKRRRTGFFGVIAFLIFLISGLIAGGLYFYKNGLEEQVKQSATDLSEEQSSFEIPLINEIIDAADKIDTAKTLLAKHKTVRPVFTFLEDHTLKDVGYSSFSYSLTGNGAPEISLAGLAKSYSILALQVEEFERQKEVKRVSFSGVSMDERGKIRFSVSIVLSPSLVNFKPE